MEPVTVGAAAAALLASKFGEGFAKDAGTSAWNAVKKLRELIAGKFKGDKDSERALARLAAEPHDAAHRTIVAQRIAEAAATDGHFGSNLAELVALAREDSATRAVFAEATDNAKQVNIGGDNFGAISL